MPVLLASALLVGGADSCSTEETGNGNGSGNNQGQTAKEKPAPSAPEMTTAQENAVQAAEDYLSFSSFSKAGLIGQLSSSAGEGFSKADATFAVNHIDVDWNEQAVRAAKDYLDYSSFSKSGLIDQLSSSAGEQFTPAQAQYAADKVYSGG